MVAGMRDPALSFRIKLVLTLALLAVVTAFGATYLTGQAREQADRAAADAHARDAVVPP